MGRINLNYWIFPVILVILSALPIGCGKSTEEVIANAQTGVMVKMTGGKRVLSVGETQTFAARLSDLAGNSVEGKVTWSSSDPAIATVDANGVVTAVAPGQTVIGASCGEETARRKIRVKAAGNGQ